VALKDGRARVYGAPSGLAGNQVLALLEDRAGNFGVGTRLGLERYREGKFTVYTTSLPDDTVLCLHEDKRAFLGSARSTDWLARKWRGQSCPVLTPILGKVEVSSITEDSTGSIWLGTHKGPMQLEDGRFTGQPF